MMKIFVIGGSGVIGSKLVKHFIEIGIDTEFTYLTNKATFGKGHILDITQKDATIELISKINPDVVVHTTALTNVDLCETNKALANSINVEGTTNVVEGCKKSNSKIVYVSTSYVFDGSKKQYFEDDLPSPATYYGITKFGGEEIVRHSGLPHLILRTDQPYCWTEKWQHTNSVLRTIDTLQSGKIHKEVVDWYNTPTYVPDFVHATTRLINDNMTGTFHLTGSDFINRYDWSIITANIFGLNANLIQPIVSDVLNLPVKRINVNLDNQKLRQKIGIQMSGAKEGVTKMFEQRPITDLP